MWKTQNRAGKVRISHQRMDPAAPMKLVRGLLFLLFVLVVWGALASSWQAWRSLGYVAVQGAVIGKSVSRSERHASDGANRHQASHYLTVQYRYEVDGTTYEGDRIHAGTFGLVSGDTLKRYGARFEKGRAVTVYVDPRDPGTAVLERGLSSVATMLYVLSVFFGFAWVVLDILVKGFAQPHPPLATAGAAPAPTRRASSSRRPLYSLAGVGQAPVAHSGQPGR